MNPYPANYSDSRGSGTTVITNDGEELRMWLRGLEFTGRCFDSLSPPEDATTEQLEQFILHDGSLCSCRLECQITVPIHDQDRECVGELFVELVLGDPTRTGNLNHEELRIILEFNHQRYAGSGKSGWFEDELLEIQSQLPAGIFIKSCINCMYSDYSPYGHGSFGFMMCFRNLKEEYVKIRTKDDFWSIHDRYDRLVQETYLCPEFKRRIPGTGYRG